MKQTKQVCSRKRRCDMILLFCVSRFTFDFGISWF
uniref:Uncharacterized protein n=1 Tax=Anguilla anguilla TaxID=7936 RepID=A0A0E9XP05_ANGAN